MKANVLLGGREEFGNIELSQPYRSILGTKLDVRTTVIGLVEDRVGAHIVVPCSSHRQEGTGSPVPDRPNSPPLEFEEPMAPSASQGERPAIKEIENGFFAVGRQYDDMWIHINARPKWRRDHASRFRNSQLPVDPLAPSFSRPQPPFRPYFSSL